MSLSARRLSPSVATDRFVWQTGDGHRTETVVPLFAAAGPKLSSTGTGAVTPALKDLPPTDDRRLERLERDAYERGVADGRQAVQAEADAKVAQATARLADAVGALAVVRGELLHRSELDLVRVAIAMAERVLRRAVDVDRELLLVMARVAIDRLGEEAAATVRLNPADHDIIQSRLASLRTAGVDVVADPVVPRNGCIVASTFGTIDVSIDSQVRELSRALLGHDDRGQAQSDRAGD